VRPIKSPLTPTEQEEALQWLADTILVRYSEQYNGAMGRERAQVLQGLRDRGVRPPCVRHESCRTQRGITK